MLIFETYIYLFGEKLGMLIFEIYFYLFVKKLCNDDF